MYLPPLNVLQLVTWVNFHDTISNINFVIFYTKDSQILEVTRFKQTTLFYRNAIRQQ